MSYNGAQQNDTDREKRVDLLYVFECTHIRAHKHTLIQWYLIPAGDLHGMFVHIHIPAYAVYLRSLRVKS